MASTEEHFERWFAANPRLPGGELLLIVDRHQPIRRMVDLIALDRDGGLVILEIKNESSNRRAIGQALEYLSQYDEPSLDELAETYEDARQGDLRTAFRDTFGSELAQITSSRRVYLVAPKHDAYSAVCTKYLSQHLGSGISFHLLTATETGIEDFDLQNFDCPAFKRMGSLETTFATNPHGRRLFYVLSPGSPPIVWSIGGWRTHEGAVRFSTMPSKRVLRYYRSYLLPLNHTPPQVSLEDSGSVWMQTSKGGRKAVVIGYVTPGKVGANLQKYVAFAQFRNGTFDTFRRRPAQVFQSQWQRTTESPIPWVEIVEQALAKIEAKRIQLAMRQPQEDIP